MPTLSHPCRSVMPTQPVAAAWPAAAAAPRGPRCGALLRAAAPTTAAPPAGAAARVLAPFPPVGKPKLRYSGVPGGELLASLWLLLFEGAVLPPHAAAVDQWPPLESGGCCRFLVWLVRCAFACCMPTYCRVADDAMLRVLGC